MWHNNLGYDPDTKFIMHNVEEEKQDFKCSDHSKKLATEFGLLANILVLPKFHFQESNIVALITMSLCWLWALVGKLS
jgi:hypothetical protein